MIEETLAITLQSIPYIEKKRIVTAFSQERGLISFILQDLSNKNPYFALCSPFCLAELILLKTKSELFILKESKVLDEHLSLRKELSHIQSAYLMAKAIMDSQLPHKSAPSLFLLLKTYLKHIPNVEFQNSILISFLLKILIHEGLIHLHEKCNLCDKKASHLHKGEALCSEHTIQYCHGFSNEEYELLIKLGQIKNISELKDLESSTDLKQKALTLFNDMI